MTFRIVRVRQGVVRGLSGRALRGGLTDVSRVAASTRDRDARP
jgi:hypothetical protein